MWGCCPGVGHPNMQRMERRGRTMVLSDGGLESLVACAAAAEAAALDTAGLRPMILAADVTGPERDTRLRAVALQAELLGMDVPTPPIADLSAPHPLTPGERETQQLLRAASIATRQGCVTLLWPARSVGEAGGLDLDSIAARVDRALLVSRLVALDAPERASFRVDTPYVDLTDRQLAELAAEMEVPLRACWWHGSRSGPGENEMKRWAGVLAGLGHGVNA